jgi:hypothetical protein
MARQPDDDERLLVPACSGTKGERVYLVELARYLRHPLPKVRKRAKYLGILYKVSRGTGLHPVAYVTIEGAMRLIAHFRAEQGRIYMSGKDFHAEAERAAMGEARRRAKRKAEREALLARSHLALAFPRAETEDESRGGRRDR